MENPQAIRLSKREYKLVILALRYAQKVGLEQALADAEKGLEGVIATNLMFKQEEEGVWITTEVKYI